MKTCLVVDDSSTQRKIMCKLVQSCGFETEEADDGLRALECCEANIPDVIILDMNMPNMTGLEFLDALKQVPIEFEPYIIVCSADVNTDSIVDAVKAGADAYHCKSSDINNLRNKLVGAAE
jgi:two-component system chemotaxis response regulator CheY